MIKRLAQEVSCYGGMDWEIWEQLGGWRWGCIWFGTLDIYPSLMFYRENSPERFG